MLIGLALRGFLAWLWLSSGWAKIGGFDDFQRTVYDYQMLPVPLAKMVSIVVPAVELIIGLFILIGLYLRPAAWASAGLLSVFCMAIGWAMSQGLQIDCGCMLGGSAEGTPVGWPKLQENAALIGASLLLAIWPCHRWGLDPEPPADQTTADK